jgi:hypothetical protein
VYPRAESRKRQAASVQQRRYDERHGPAERSAPSQSLGASGSPAQRREGVQSQPATVQDRAQQVVLPSRRSFTRSNAETWENVRDADFAAPYLSSPGRSTILIRIQRVGSGRMILSSG